MVLLKSSRRQSRTARLADRVGPAAADARETAVRYAGNTRDWASPRVEAAREWAEPRVETAKDWAAPRVETAKDWAAPRVETGVAKVKDDVLPAVAETVAEAVTAALVASEPVIEEAKSRGTAAVAALRGELEPPRRKRGKLRKLFFLAVLAGAAVVGWKVLTARSKDEEPSPWATPVANPAPDAGWSDLTADDAAGAGPDEALADAAEELAAADADPDAIPETTTEPVSPEQSEAVNKAAKKTSTRP